jgi:glutamyl-tRNA synthetase
MEQLIEAFSIERVGKSGSRFDPEKSRWFNHQYLQKKDNRQLALEFSELITEKGDRRDIESLVSLVALVKERVNFVKDIWQETDFFFVAPESFDSETIKKRWKEDTATQMRELYAELEQCENFTAETTEVLVKSWIAKKGYAMGAIMSAFRLVIVGALRGPHIFDIISWIGKEETLRRIYNGINILVVNG